MCLTNRFIKEFGPLCRKAHWSSGRTLALRPRVRFPDVLSSAEFLLISGEKFIGFLIFKI